MRVESFKVSNFRSIRSAEIPLADLTSLVGANNEGKSNILRALVAAMNMLVGAESRRGPSTARRSRSYRFMSFHPVRDVPYDRPNSRSKVEIRLLLDDAECEAFFQTIGHRINGELRFEVDFSSKPPGRVKVIKQRSGTALTDKSEQIAEFVGDRLRLEYVPAVRTAEQAVDVVQRLVLDQLRVLRRDPDYVDALERIRKLETPLLEQIGLDIRESLSEFLPDVESVEIASNDRVVASRPVRDVLDITIDDGVPTDLGAKGDGVQSLAAIALMRRAAVAGDEERHLLLAVEEPETHLHPAAVRRLRGVLREISGEHQVVVTTHSPLLIDTERPSSNVVVLNNEAKPAAAVEEIRECLGVEISDNLRSARLVLIVEGDNDVRILRSVLSDRSSQIADLLSRGELAIEALGTASRLSAHASAMRASACSLYAVLDGDDEGRRAVEKAVADGRVAPADYRLTHREGLRESEIEDLILFGKARAEIEQALGVTMNVGAFGKGGPKWSEKLVGQLRKQGKLGSDTEVGTAKRIVAETIEGDPTALRKEGAEWFDGLIAILEGRLT